MKKAILVIIIVLSVMFSPLIVKSSNDKLVGVYFYPWYSISLHRHRDNTVIDKPVIDYYDSDDPHVIKWQLNLIKEAEIDFIVFSWWGPGSFEDNTTKIIAKYLNDYNLKFAIMVEPYLGNDHPEYYNKTFWENVINYLEQNYISKYPNYLYLDGKPLILAFNPIGMNYNPSQDFLNYTIWITGNDIDNAKYQDWDYWPDYIDTNNLELRIRRDGYVSIIPRYDDTHFRTPGICLDQNYTLGLYQREWEWIIEHRDKINIVMITSWNEYHERTMIEPHIDATANVSAYYIYDLTKQYIEELKKTSLIPSYIYGFSNYVFAWGMVLFIFGSIARIILRVLLCGNRF